MYKPECIGNTEKIWEHLTASRNSTSQTEERCCYDGEGDPKSCDPKIKQAAASAAEAYAEFIAAYGCGQARRTVRISNDEPNYWNALEAAKAKN